MANIFGIEVSGDTYDLEDTTARNGVSENAQAIDDVEIDIQNINKVLPKYQKKNGEGSLNIDTTYRKIQSCYIDVPSGKTCILKGVATYNTLPPTGCAISAATSDTFSYYDAIAVNDISGQVTGLYHNESDSTKRVSLFVRYENSGVMDASYNSLEACFLD